MSASGSTSGSAGCEASGSDEFDCTEDGSVLRSFSAAHLAIMFSMFVLTFLVYMLWTNIRARRLSRWVAEIPRRRLPFGREQLGRRIQEKAVATSADMGRDDAIPPPGDGRTAEDFGFTKPPTSLWFKDNVLLSFNVLVRDVIGQRVPSLAPTGNETARDYIMRLPDTFPELDPAVCDAYAGYHEFAEFCEDEMTQDDYNDFVILFSQQLIPALTRPQPSPRVGSGSDRWN